MSTKWTKIIAGVIVAGAACLTSAHGSMAASNPSFVPVPFPASIPLDPHVITAPATGCLKVIDNSPIVDARTGAILGYGKTTDFICDKSSDPNAGNWPTVYTSPTPPPVGTSASSVTPTGTSNSRG